MGNEDLSLQLHIPDYVEWNNINDLKDYYKVSSIKAIDIFSQTEHVETIALLFKLKTDKHIDCDEC